MVRENFTEKILPELRSEGRVGVSDIEVEDRGDLEGGVLQTVGMACPEPRDRKEHPNNQLTE